MPVAELEPTIPASERQQTLSLDSSATEIGKSYDLQRLIRGKIQHFF